MTPERQRLKISEVMGWTLEPVPGYSALRKWQRPDDGTTTYRDISPPFYHHNRDAILEAISRKIDRHSLLCRFDEEAQKSIDATKDGVKRFYAFDLLTASPAVLCEIFLRTFDLWEE